jgi:hypothetical protein
LVNFKKVQHMKSGGISQSSTGAAGVHTDVSADNSKRRGPAASLDKGIGIGELKSMLRVAEKGTMKKQVFGGKYDAPDLVVPEGWDDISKGEGSLSRRVDIDEVAKAGRKGILGLVDKIRGNPMHFKKPNRKELDAAHKSSTLEREQGIDLTQQWGKSASIFEPGNLERLLKEQEEIEGLDDIVHNELGPAKEFPAHLRETALFKDGKFEEEYN